MAGIVVVTAAAIFILGFALGVIFLVSRGIVKEEQLWREERKRWEEENLSRDPGSFSALPPTPITRPTTDRGCQAARGFVHLWVRKQEGTGQRVPQQRQPDERPHPYGQSALGSRQDWALPGPQDTTAY